jgi:hypothetical protein
MLESQMPTCRNEIKQRNLLEIYSQFGPGKGEAKGFPNAKDEMAQGTEDT